MTQLHFVRDGRVRAVAVCALVSLLTTQLTGPTSGLAYRIGFQSVACTAMLLTVVAAWRHRHTLGPAGLLLALGLVFSCVGDTGHTTNTLSGSPVSFPTWADGCFLLLYGCLMTSAVLIVRRRRLSRNVAALIDTATLTVGVGVLAYCFVIADIATDSSASTLARLTGAMYPICDVLLVGVMTRLLFSSTGHRGPVLMLTGGMFCLFAGDVGLILAVFAGAQIYSWTDTLYLLSALMIMLSLWQKDTDRLVQANEQTDERLGATRTAALAAGALLAPVTLLVQDIGGDDPHVRAAAIGAVVLFVLTLIRMSLLVRAVQSQSEQLSRLARTDGLTGLANRRTLDFELERAMKEALDADPGIEVLSIGLLDLDHFKRFNDTYGHSHGDQLLKQCAAHWTDALSRLSPRSFMARYGGEEFVVIFRGEGTRVAAEILRELLPLTPMEQTFSAGVATWDGAEMAVDLLNRADKRLYAAKFAGRNQIVGEQLSDFAS